MTGALVLADHDGGAFWERSFGTSLGISGMVMVVGLLVLGLAVLGGRSRGLAASSLVALVVFLGAGMLGSGGCQLTLWLFAQRSMCEGPSFVLPLYLVSGWLAVGLAGAAVVTRR